MTRDELLKLEPGTLVDVYDGGAFVGTHTYNGGCNGESALVVDKYGNYEAVSYLCLELHTTQPQVSGTIETGPQEKSKSIEYGYSFGGGSGTIETPPKLYTLRFGHGIPATDEQIMEQECVVTKRGSDAKDWLNINKALNETKARLTEAQNTERILNDEIAKRNEQISRLRGQVEDLVERLEAPPTTDEVEHAYNTLIVAGYKNEASVLRTLSHVVERLSERLEETEQLPDVENN